MTGTAPDLHDVIARLRASNPAQLDPRRAHSPAARSALARILADAPPDAASPSPLTRLRGRVRTGSARGLAAVGAILVVSAGGALAATDPMGWWSAAPDHASYASSPSVRVATPTARIVRCLTGASDDVVCSPASALRRGQSYIRIGSIPQPGSTSFPTRRSLLAHVMSARAQGRVSAADAARLRADIVAAPQSFFTTMALASRYGTFGIVPPHGKILVPPVGTPMFLVCMDGTASQLSCRNLNGDSNAPVGGGVYAAYPTRAWRAVAAKSSASDYRLLGDMQRFGTVLRAGK